LAWIGSRVRKTECRANQKSVLRILNQSHETGAKFVARLIFAILQISTAGATVAIPGNERLAAFENTDALRVFPTRESEERRHPKAIHFAKGLEQFISVPEIWPGGRWKRSLAFGARAGRIRFAASN
jgi:hypothetical protein